MEQKPRVTRATPAEEEYGKALNRALGKEGADIDALVVLAITCRFVGRLIALQDQRVYTNESIMDIVNLNITDGNRQMREFLLSNTSGSA